MFEDGAMEAIRLNGRIDQDGVLKLEIPVNMPDTDVEVMVIVQPREKRKWHEGYFERTAGSLADTGWLETNTD